MWCTYIKFKYTYIYIFIHSIYIYIMKYVNICLSTFLVRTCYFLPWKVFQAGHSSHLLGSKQNTKSHRQGRWENIGRNIISIKIPTPGGRSKYKLGPMALQFIGVRCNTSFWFTRPFIRFITWFITIGSGPTFVFLMLSTVGCPCQTHPAHLFHQQKRYLVLPWKLTMTLRVLIGNTSSNMADFSILSPHRRLHESSRWLKTKPTPGTGRNKIMPSYVSFRRGDKFFPLGF